MPGKTGLAPKEKVTKEKEKEKVAVKPQGCGTDRPTQQSHEFCPATVCCRTRPSEEMGKIRFAKIMLGHCLNHGCATEMCCQSGSIKVMMKMNCWITKVCSSKIAIAGNVWRTRCFSSKSKNVHWELDMKMMMKNKF